MARAISAQLSQLIPVGNSSLLAVFNIEKKSAIVSHEGTDHSVSEL